MNGDSVPRRVLARFFGVEPYPPIQFHPPATAGYSVAHRVLAGLLGVRLPERDRATTDAGVERPVEADAALPVMENVSVDALNSKTPITDAIALLSVWDVSTRLRARGLVVELVKHLKTAEHRARALDQAFATNQALGAHDSIIRANAIGDLLANASSAAENLAATEPDADTLVRILDRASRLTDLFAQGQGFGDALANDLASASAALTTIAHDFRHTDVRGVDLSDVVLVGVRWDATTRWPTDWVDRIQRASEEEQGFPGVFVVQAEPETAFEPVIV